MGPQVELKMWPQLKFWPLTCEGWRESEPLTSVGWSASRPLTLVGELLWYLCSFWLPLSAAMRRYMNPFWQCKKYLPLCCYVLRTTKRHIKKRKFKKWISKLKHQVKLINEKTIDVFLIHLRYVNIKPKIVRLKLHV